MKFSGKIMMIFLIAYLDFRNWLLNPLRHSTPYKNFNFKIRRDQEKISYERRVYESADDKTPSILGYISNINGKQNLCHKELNELFVDTDIKFYSGWDWLGSSLVSYSQVRS